MNEERLDNVLQFIEDNDIGISCLCETWFDSQKGKFTARIKEAGFEIVHANRDDRRGGGVAILYKKSLRVKPGEESTTKFSSFEFAYCCIQASRSKIVLLGWGAFPIFDQAIFAPPSNLENMYVHRTQKKSIF